MQENFTVSLLWNRRFHDHIRRFLNFIIKLILLLFKTSRKKPALTTGIFNINTSQLCLLLPYSWAISKLNKEDSSVSYMGSVLFAFFCSPAFSNPLSFPLPATVLSSLLLVSNRAFRFLQSSLVTSWSGPKGPNKRVSYYFDAGVRLLGAKANQHTAEKTAMIKIIQLLKIKLNLHN